MLLPVLIVIKQHSLISPETKVCLLGSPCSLLAIMFSQPGSVIVTARDLRHEPGSSCPVGSKTCHVLLHDCENSQTGTKSVESKETKIILKIISLYCIVILDFSFLAKFVSTPH